MRRRLITLAAVAAATLTGPAVAHAGYAVQPSDGAVVAPDPAFVVVLDRFDSIATVHVSSSPTFSSSGYPTVSGGSCIPSTPFGEPDKYTCKPSFYAPAYESKLAPGTYYWWLSFWRNNPAEGPGSAGMRVSGPFRIVVPAPTAPAQGTAGLVSPADGARVTSPTRLSVRAPAGSKLRIHASTSDEQMDDGSPVGLDHAGCEGEAVEEDVYWCEFDDPLAADGDTYYWWAVIEAGGGSWTYGPWRITIGSRPAGGSGGAAPARTRFAAPNLPTVRRWKGASTKHQRLTQAVYQYSKSVGYPRRVAVACWSDRDWPTVSESANPHLLYGFWSRLQPRWLHLAPRICRAMETLLTSRPVYPNVITANALSTVAHEMLHAMGIRNEAMTECFAMQTGDVLGWHLGIRGQYLRGLSRLFLAANRALPPRYRDAARCREDGAWDLAPGEPSAPWHP